MRLWVFSFQICITYKIHAGFFILSRHEWVIQNPLIKPTAHIFLFHGADFKIESTPTRLLNLLPRTSYSFTEQILR